MEMSPCSELTNSVTWCKGWETEGCSMASYHWMVEAQRTDSPLSSSEKAFFEYDCASCVRSAMHCGNGTWAVKDDVKRLELTEKRTVRWKCSAAVERWPHLPGLLTR